MQTGNSIPPAKTARARIIWLVSVQVLVGLLLGAIAATEPKPGPDLLGLYFVGLVFSQTSLLEIWAGSGTNRWWIRLLGVLAGVGYLGPHYGICIDELNPRYVFLVAFATLIVTAVLLVVRCFGFRTRLDSDQEPRATEMQFSIRHMMLLTLVVACLLALAKWLQPYLDPEMWLFLVGLAIPFATVGLVAAWGVLGSKRPVLGILVLLAVAVGAGYGLARYSAGGDFFTIWITATLTEALSLTVSLLVVRRCGYRLRRRGAGRVGSGPRQVA